MSQCPTASATPSTVLDSQPSGLLDATPYVSQIASTVWQSQELPLSQLTPRTLKRRLDLDSQEEGSQISCVLPPLSRRWLAVLSNREDLENGGSSIVPSMVSQLSSDLWFKGLKVRGTITNGLGDKEGRLGPRGYGYG
ncbi:hypothetical protein RhiXN_11690 [Rhizoctonia solani]|uniref:Uncharacterized protein n=1 Tax=Rhizoctonia solani TaxID=456999 RepID=A0A8H8T1S0_9AGAM|nr:uncharacterized protein RhiXN_11690 [Rhizoctonia solani]QRW24778.1 hypothetical protein RhiXN_11690 [Rhizoctonia solani]